MSYHYTVPKTKPIISVETDIRPICLTPIVAKVVEYFFIFLLKHINTG